MATRWATYDVSEIRQTDLVCAKRTTNCTNGGTNFDYDQLKLLICYELVQEFFRQIYPTSTLLLNCRFWSLADAKRSECFCCAHVLLRPPAAFGSSTLLLPWFFIPWFCQAKLLYRAALFKLPSERVVCVLSVCFLTPPSWIFERLENVEVPPSEKDEKAGLFYTGGESLMRFDEFWRVDLVLIVDDSSNPM